MCPNSPSTTIIQRALTRPSHSYLCSCHDCYMSHHNVLNTDLYDILCNYNNLRESIISLLGCGVKNKNLVHQVKTLNTIEMKTLYIYIYIYIYFKSIS
jgi:protein-arginine kinase activator protein McsA